MAELFLAKKRVESVFQLLGRRENDMTYSLGWALSQCSSFLSEFLRSQLRYSGKVDTKHIDVRLQQHEATTDKPDETGILLKGSKNQGLTDVEIEDELELFVIIEAKAGAVHVDRKQIEKYCDRKSFRESKAHFKKVVTLTENKEYAQLQLTRDPVDSSFQDYVTAISWSDVNSAARAARKRSSHKEQALLDQFTSYLGYAMRTHDIRSNQVLVVLKRELPGTKIRVKDFVEKHKAYVHPFGQKWPRVPTNYIAFTDQGKIGSIHWVKKVTTSADPQETFSELPPSDGKEFLIYHLERGFAPSEDVRVGKMGFNRFVYCMLDTLFTSKTIVDARKQSQSRWTA